MQYKRTSLILLLFLIISAGRLLAQNNIEYHEGEITREGQEDIYLIDIEAGQGIVITAEGLGSSDLDTTLRLQDAGGNLIAENDDYQFPHSTDSQIAMVVYIPGQYAVVVSSYGNSRGSYRLTIELTTEDEIEAILAATSVDTTPQREADLVFQGTLGYTDEASYSLDLEAGQGLVAAAYSTDGNLDSILTILNPQGEGIALNDDRVDYPSSDSQLAFIAQDSGRYTIVLKNNDYSTGNYQLDIYFASYEEVLIAEQASRVLLSGPVQVYTSQNFAVHYTLEGRDASELAFVEQVANTAEEAYAIQMNLGWEEPLRDSGQGGDERIDIYLVDLTFYSYTDSSSPAGDNPNTDVLEDSAQAGFMVLDNDNAEFGDPIRVMHASIAYSFHTLVQLAYDGTELSWYHASTSAWMETITFPEDEEATIYTSSILNHPEICFGAQGESDDTGLAIYGHWLFLEFISRELDEDIVLRLWENLAIYDGWDALEETLEPYHVTLPEILARYHLNNLMRDYAFLDAFAGQHVPLEGTISSEGLWTQHGEGVQQLAANYFEFTAPQGVYALDFKANYTRLEFYGIGINGDSADIYDLGDEGIIDTHGYEHYYIMVFNTDLVPITNTCLYQQYEIEVEATSNRAEPLWMSLNAEHFLAP